MSRALPALFALVLLTGCTQAFRFTDEDAGFDAGIDAGFDAGCQLPGECECGGDGGCPAERPSCTADHRCVECLTDPECGTNGRCDPSTRRCTTTCTSDPQCTVGTRTDCHDGHCVGCDDFPNTCSAPTPVCAESVGYCVECKSDSQCAAPTPRCDRRFGTCVRCLQSSHCAPAEYCVLATGVCLPRP